MYKMDLPFTSFFLICLLNFQRNMALPYTGNPVATWPRKCAGLNYCTKRPDGYPSESLLKDLYSGVNVTIEIPAQETGDRSGDPDLRNLCRINYKHQPVYMIIDENNEARYAIQVPGIYQFNVTLRTCHYDQQLEELAEKLECKQRYTSLPLLVLSHDKTKLEVARVKGGLPTNCAPFIKDSVEALE